MTAAPLNSTDWRPLYPFASHWLDLPAGRMHFLDEGPRQASSADTDSQETLLFIHGNPTWSFHWRNFIAELRDKHRCVAVDHIGCGLSDKPPRLLTLDDHIANLQKLVEELDLRHVTLAAQDWGGAIGIGAMLGMRERLKRFVLFNT